MKNQKDFELNLSKVKKAGSRGRSGTNGAEPMWKSKSLCTPGCITGILMTCPIQTATCGCHFG